MDYLHQAKEILSGCLFLPLEKIPDNAALHDINELDSLAFESIVTEIETRTGRSMETMDLLRLRSVQDLANLLQRYAP